MSIFYTSVFAPKEKRGRRPAKKPDNLIYIAVASAALLLVLAVLVAMLFRGPSQSPPPALSQDQTSGGYSAQVFNLVGQIVKIEDSSVILKSTQQGEESDKKVAIVSGTTITRLDFVPVITGNQKRFAPQETVISFSALKVGWTVEAMASRDIANAEQFNAVQIRVLP